MVDLKIDVLIAEAISDIEDIKEELDDLLESLKDIRFALESADEQETEKSVPEDEMTTKIKEIVEDVIKKLPSPVPLIRRRTPYPPVEPWDYQPTVID